MKKMWTLYWISLVLTIVLCVLSAVRVGILYGFCAVNMLLFNTIGVTIFIAMVISYIWFWVVYISGGNAGPTARRKP